MTGQKRLFSVALVSLFVLGCSTIRPFSPEYAKAYALAQDTIIGDCHTFIMGSLEASLGAPSRLTCFRHDYLGHPENAIILKKGSAVRVKRFFQGIDVDLGRIIAELAITDPESGVMRAVYAPDWGRHREQVLIEDPSSSGSLNVEPRSR